MAGAIRADAKIDEPEMASIMAELRRSQDGEFGERLGGGSRTGSAYTRQPLGRHPPIVLAYRAAIRASAEPKPVLAMGIPSPRIARVAHESLNCLIKVQNIVAARSQTGTTSNTDGNVAIAGDAAVRS